MGGISCKRSLKCPYGSWRTLIVDPSPSSPDRWDNLPEAVTSLPGLYSNTLTFSAGPRVRFFSPTLRDFRERLTNAFLIVVLRRPALLAD